MASIDAGDKRVLVDVARANPAAQARDPAKWAGFVSLDALGAGRVSKLWLQHFALETLPASIGALTATKEVWLGSNLLESVPDALCTLEQLEGLWLQNNRISRLPASLSGLKSLTSLRLQHNSLTELPDSLFDLESLMTLDISSNHLTALSPRIGRLTTLQELSAGDNAIAVIPPEVGTLRVLNTLILSANRIASCPKEIGRLTALVSLWLDSNLLAEDVPSPVRALTSRNLIQLRVENNLFNAFTTHTTPKTGGAPAVAPVATPAPRDSKGAAVPPSPSTSMSKTMRRYLEAREREAREAAAQARLMAAAAASATGRLELEQRRHAQELAAANDEIARLRAALERQKAETARVEGEWALLDEELAETVRETGLRIKSLQRALAEVTATFGEAQHERDMFKALWEQAKRELGGCRSDKANLEERVRSFVTSALENLGIPTEGEEPRLDGMSDAQEEIIEVMSTYRQESLSDQQLLQLTDLEAASRAAVEAAGRAAEEEETEAADKAKALAQDALASVLTGKATHGFVTVADAELERMGRSDGEQSPARAASPSPAAGVRLTTAEAAKRTMSKLRPEERKKLGFLVEDDDDDDDDYGAADVRGEKA